MRSATCPIDINRYIIKTNKYEKCKYYFDLNWNTNFFDLIILI